VVHRTQVHVKLDNSKCTSQCFDNTDRAAEFIAQSLRHGWKPELPIYAVKCQYLISTLIIISNLILIILQKQLLFIFRYVRTVIT